MGCRRRQQAPARGDGAVPGAWLRPGDRDGDRRTGRPDETLVLPVLRRQARSPVRRLGGLGGGGGVRGTGRPAGAAPDGRRGGLPVGGGRRAHVLGRPRSPTPTGDRVEPGATGTRAD